MSRFFMVHCVVMIQYIINLTKRCTSGVKFDLKFDFSVPDFLYVEKFWKLDQYFR